MISLIPRCVAELPSHLFSPKVHTHHPQPVALPDPSPTDFQAVPITFFTRKVRLQSALILAGFTLYS